MASVHKRGEMLTNGLSGFLKTLTSDTFTLLKITAPILLLVSFITVLNGWLELRASINVAEPMRDILNVPLMLFGVIAIINVMIFREASSSTFLAVFFIGTVIAGSEMADKALRAVGGTVAVYETGSGGLGQTPYNISGGLVMKEGEEAGSTDGTPVKPE